MVGTAALPQKQPQTLAGRYTVAGAPVRRPLFVGRVPPCATDAPVPALKHITTDPYTLPPFAIQPARFPSEVDIVRRPLYNVNRRVHFLDLVVDNFNKGD